MVKPIFSFLFMVLMVSCTTSTTIEIAEGVSKELAEHRASIISDVAYDLEFTIPEHQDSSIHGKISINFNLTQLHQDLQIDFKEKADAILSINANEQSCPINHVKEHIIIPKNLLSVGTNKVVINFIAGNQSLNRKTDFLYTLLVPDRARTVFPLFDQPDLKATYLLSLVIPREWKALANGAIQTVESVDHHQKITFNKTLPISSYLFAFTAGKFRETYSSDGTMRMLYRETDDEKVGRNKEDIFHLHQSSLDWLEDYTAIDYPFNKFDFALIPSFQYGGMEHVGAIFYNERSLLLDKNPSINRQLRRASLIAHETAHMWFGDLVTMKWFDDVWLKEVFANFMAAKIVNPQFPEVNHDLRFLLAHYPRAYAIDRSEGSHPIQQDLPNLNNAGTLYGSIIYQKAPIVMRNLESIIGVNQFQSGIQEYLRTYSFGNATWDDLINIMAPFTDRNLNEWNQDWVKSPGMPTLEISVKQNEDGAGQIITYNNQGDRSWPQDVTVTMRSIGGIDKQTIELNKGISSLILPPGRSVISYNDNGTGYGYFKAPIEHTKSALEYVNNESNPQKRAEIWMTGWEELLHHRIDQKDFFNYLLDAVEKENNPLLLNHQMPMLRQIYWSWMSDDERNAEATVLETILWSRLTTEQDVSIRRSIYNTYINIATTPLAIKNLVRIYDDQANEIGLPISNRDKENIVYQLGVLDYEKIDQLYGRQLKAISNPDDIGRMKFVQPAISSDAKVREEFFNSLSDEVNRRNERWVLTALNYLHHPLRHNTSNKYLLPSLIIIEEIQTTGDIFFPKRWLDNTLGSYSDLGSANVVRSYLQENDQLSDNLKNKILQAADPLLRSSARNLKG